MPLISWIRWCVSVGLKQKPAHPVVPRSQVKEQWPRIKDRGKAGSGDCDLQQTGPINKPGYNDAVWNGASRSCLSTGGCPNRPRVQPVVHTTQEDAERMAHNKSPKQSKWNGIKHLETPGNVFDIWYHSTNSARSISMSPASTIKVPPASCGAPTDISKHWNNQKVQRKRLEPDKHSHVLHWAHSTFTGLLLPGVNTSQSSHWVADIKDMPHFSTSAGLKTLHLLCAGFSTRLIR